MSRRLRILIAVAVTALSSGIPQVVMAALDDDCCTGPCDGFDGQCPPNCSSGVCAKVHVSLGAIAAPSVGQQPFRSRATVIAEPVPQLPLVVTGLFHPPRA